MRKTKKRLLEVLGKESGDEKQMNPVFYKVPICGTK